MSPAATPQPVRNALTVDVEDYFQVYAFARTIDRSSWEGIPTRVERNVALMLDMFAERGAKATFFTLGWVAERHPAMVRRIVAEGHELASHGYDHTRADAQDRAAFAEDVRRTKRILEDLGGQKVIGYRAATFSIGAKNQWAFEVLQDEEYRYSSSIYPVRHDNYGTPDAPRFPYHPLGLDLWELPMTTVAAGRRNLPISGGGYFRLLPYEAFRLGLRHYNRAEGRPGIFYTHPWEVDPDQPRVAGAGRMSRVRHYVNLSRTEPRMRRLLRDFAWGRMDDVFGDLLHTAHAGAAEQSPKVVSGAVV